MKRKLSLALVVTMALGSVNTVSAQTFTDTQGNWAQSQIDRWSEYNVLGGYADGSFKPEGYITRAEMASMIDKIMGYKIEGENVYTDVNSDAWYASAILKNAAAGNMVIEGETVNPNEYISRQEVAVMVCNALDIDAIEAITTFADDSSIDDWAKGSVAALENAGYISGRPGNLYAPTENITRAEVVTLLDNIIKKVYTDAGKFSTITEGSVVVNTENVVLRDTTIEGDLIVSAGVGEGDLTLDNVYVEGEIIVEGGGSHSVKLTNGTKANRIKLQKASEETVRLFVDEKSEVSMVQTAGNSGILLEGNGAFGEVTVVGTNEVTVAESTIIDKLEVTNGGTVVNNGTIEEVTVAETAGETVISGKGKITVVISDNGSLSLYNTVGKLIISNPNAQIKVSENVAKVTDKNGNDVKDKVEVENKGNGNSNSNSNGNGNGNSNSNDNTNTSVNNAPDTKYGIYGIGRSLTDGATELIALNTIYSDKDGDALTYYFVTGENTYSANDLTVNSTIKTSNEATFKIENGTLKANNATDGTYVFNVVAFDGKTYSKPIKFEAELYGNRINTSASAGSKIDLTKYFGATPSVEMFMGSSVYTSASEVCTLEGSYLYINETLLNGAGELYIYDNNSDKVLVVSLVTMKPPATLVTSASAIVVKGETTTIDASSWFTSSSSIRLSTSKDSDEIDYPSTSNDSTGRILIIFKAEDLVNAVIDRVYKISVYAKYYDPKTGSYLSESSNPVTLYVTVK